MYEENHYARKTPTILIVLFAVNLVLMIALEILLVYKFPAELTAGELAEYDSVYEDCTILAEDTLNQLRCYLVQTSTGEVHLFPVRMHTIFFSRARIYDDQIIPIPTDSAETVCTLKMGIRSPSVIVRSEGGTLSLDIEKAYFGGVQEIVGVYFLINALLILLELGIGSILKKNLT